MSQKSPQKAWHQHYFAISGVALFVTLAVLGVLNGPWLLTEARYHFAAHQHTVAVLGASTTTPSAGKDDAPLPKPDPTAPAQLWIPAINAKAPIVFDEPSNIEWKVQLALRRGVLHYADTALPGQKGNVVIFGHSSGQTFAPGDYKWVFTLLNKLQPGDQVEISYQGIPYIYQVTDSTVVHPDDFSILKQTDTPTLTLVTCTPVGTSTNRLIVHARLIK